MRIAIASRNRRKIGGTETYLNNLIPTLLDAGHELLFLSETDEPVNREEITLPERLLSLSVAQTGLASAMAALRDWRPDIINNHGIEDTNLERELLQTAPAIFFAHTFTGTCISGQKTFKSPEVRPCHRRFGWQCLLQYYPHRCGGLNPITMANLYLTQVKRLENLRQYQAIVTHSSYLYQEFINHGFEPGRLYRLSESHEPASAVTEELPLDRPIRATDRRSQPEAELPAAVSRETAARLLYLGRMEFLKGGEVFLDALPQSQARLGRPLHVTFAGDGAHRHRWEGKASQLQSQNRLLSCKFVGWLRGAQLDSTLADSDLLVLPSLWPEPFGLVGLEAGRAGLPVAAFAVGGIPEWLFDGVNGYLAPGDPPTAGGLANAIVRCLVNPDHHAELRRGAIKISHNLYVDTRVPAFVKILEEVGNTSLSV